MATEKRGGFPANVGDFVTKHPFPVILGAGALLQPINAIAAASIISLGLVRCTVIRASSKTAAHAMQLPCCVFESSTYPHLPQVGWGVAALKGGGKQNKPALPPKRMMVISICTSCTE